MICSSVPGAISSDLSSIDAWFGLFNFIYQLLVLYDRDFNFIKKMKSICYRICKKNETILNENERKILVIMSISVNQCIPILFVHLFLWFSTEKGLYHYMITSGCDFSLQAEIVANIRVENIILLLVFTCAMILGLAVKKKADFKLIWVNEDFGPLFQIYYTVLLHILVDTFLQYYFYIFYLKNMS